MVLKQPVRLGATEETLLVPLFARALESQRKHPLVQDPRAAEIVAAIDWDYQRFNQRVRMLACVLRTAMFDQWTLQFLREHRSGTVVEIGCGLNTRFERLDNGSLHWFDLDLPGVIELRRKFFRDGDRRQTLSASVLDAGWMETVRASPPPYFFVAETVLIYLAEAEVKSALAQIACAFPGARMAFDTGSWRAVTGGNKDFVRRNMPARFAWACDDPRTIESWNIGMRLIESLPLTDVRDPVRSRLSLPVRATFRLLNSLFPKLMRVYQLNLFETVAVL
jgi:O-methyltransferase involved in polyketide biosynthesis